MKQKISTESDARNEARPCLLRLDRKIATAYDTLTGALSNIPVPLTIAEIVQIAQKHKRSPAVVQAAFLISSLFIVEGAVDGCMISSNKRNYSVLRKFFRILGEASNTFCFTQNIFKAIGGRDFSDHYAPYSAVFAGVHAFANLYYYLRKHADDNNGNCSSLDSSSRSSRSSSCLSDCKPYKVVRCLMRYGANVSMLFSIPANICSLVTWEDLGENPSAGVLVGSLVVSFFASMYQMTEYDEDAPPGIQERIGGTIVSCASALWMAQFIANNAEDLVSVEVAALPLSLLLLLVTLLSCCVTREPEQEEQAGRDVDDVLLPDRAPDKTCSLVSIFNRCKRGGNRRESVYTSFASANKYN